LLRLGQLGQIRGRSRCANAREVLHYVKKVSASPLEVDPMDKKGFGFSEFNENLNGRLAMLGIVIGFATELLTGKGILAQLGLM
jgi:hypothetical protein